MEAELAGHLECLTADLVRTGHSPVEAGRRARIALGAVTVHKEGMRASLGLRWWDEFWADLRYGARILRRSPGFTAIGAASLALAIGANTAIFSIAKSLLYDRLNVPHAETLRLLQWTGDDKVVAQNVWGDYDGFDGGVISSSFTYPAFVELRAHNRVLDALFAFKGDGMNATMLGNAERVQVEMVSGGYYGGLGVRPQLGRAIGPADDAAPGAGAVAVISDGVWEREFGRSPSVLGQTITLNQTALTIVGVNPRGFTGAKNVQMSPDVFVPLSLQPVIDPKGKKGSMLADPSFWWLNIMGRAKPGVKDTAARAALDVQLEAAIRGTTTVKPGDSMPHVALSDGSRGLHEVDGMLKQPVYVLLALTGFVLLLACANIANLLLARGAQRQREMSVRLAMGAGRARILRQLLTESLLLAGIGGLGGLLLGYVGRGAIPRLLSNAWERNEFNIPFDWGVFAFAAGVTILTGVFFGLAPAWSAARAEVGSSLKETARTATRRRKGLGGKALVAFQIALSTLLVVGSGLFLRTLFVLSSVDVGFRPENLMLFEINPPVKRYPAGKDVQLHARLEQAFAAVPGVEMVTPVSVPYIAGSTEKIHFLPEGEGVDVKKEQGAFVNAVGSNFFQTLSIPIVAGRAFGAQDTATSAKVAIINESLARARFPHENPLGKRFSTLGDAGEGLIQIVGICKDTRYDGLRNDPPPQFLLPYVQQPDAGGMTYVIRTRMQPAVMVPSLRRVIQSVDRDLPMIDVRTQQEQIDASMQMERIFAALTAGFGVLALTLACVGIYGIMAYSVANRTNEIGIRLALGARPAQVRGMILRESAWLTVAGVAAGGAAALALARLVRSMLYGIQPWDPATMIGGVSILLAVALAASWIPARRAAGVQPMEALRHE